MKRLIPMTVLVIGAGWGLAAPSHAQTLEEQGYRPVDQFVEDIDPLGTTLREDTAGLLTIGERANVYRRIVPGADPTAQREDRLYYISYGVVAEYDQSQYAIVERSGAILQFIPPNTVFHIGLPDAGGEPADAQRPLVPGQIDGRVDGRVTAEAQSYLQPQPLVEPEPQVTPMSQAPPAGVEQRYGILVVSQRSVVLTALNRMASGK